MWRLASRSLSCALLLVACAAPQESEADLYGTALSALRDSIAVWDSTPMIRVQAEPLLKKEGAYLPAPGDKPEHFEPGRIDGLVQFVDTAAGWSLCPAPAFACVKGLRPAHVLSVSRPSIVPDSVGGGVTIWATYGHIFEREGDVEVLYYKVTLHRTQDGWRADPVVSLGAEG